MLIRSVAVFLRLFQHLPVPSLVRPDTPYKPFGFKPGQLFLHSFGCNAYVSGKGGRAQSTILKKQRNDFLPTFHLFLPTSLSFLPTSDKKDDDEAVKAALALTRTEGIIPALESAHALGALDHLNFRPDDIAVLTVSGRGNKDMDTYLKHIE